MDVGLDPRHPNKPTNKAIEKGPLETRSLTYISEAEQESMMRWMLIMTACVCIMKRCRPTRISTLNIRACYGNFKQDIKLKGTKRRYLVSI